MRGWEAVLIAIDTSTETAGLAIANERRLAAEFNWHCGHNHSTQLLPALERLLEQTGLSLTDAECIIVARGPGSYNGLRVGISTAKSLAFSLDIPVIAVSTLETEAWQYAQSGLPVCPVLNAGREEVATATYCLCDGVWEQVTKERLTTLEELCAATDEKTLFCGEYVYSVVEMLREKLGEKAVIPSQLSAIRRAGFLAEMGLKRFIADDYDDTATLQPAYFRGPSITKPKSGKK